MFKAILFDLDDTLLRNEMNAFVNAYFGTLMPKISAAFPDANIRDAIMSATQAMIASKVANKTLRDVFIADFEAATGLDFPIVEPLFMDYYQNEYCDVVKVTSRVAHAGTALQAAQKITPNVALATIPIFPLIAIEERMRWAGISDFPFALVTSFEMMHASKPHPEYYAEIAYHLNCAPEECLMIGNDYHDDMIAKAVGMKTFLVTDFAMREDKKKYEPDYQGSLKEVAGFLSSLIK